MFIHMAQNIYGTLVMFVSMVAWALWQMFLDLFTYIINGGHQQQDDGDNVQDNDSSQNQHCGFRRNWSKENETAHALLYNMWMH